jgi:multidrug resistance efflux pump
MSIIAHIDKQPFQAQAK